MADLLTPYFENRTESELYRRANFAKNDVCHICLILHLGRLNLNSTILYYTMQIVEISSGK